MNHAHPRAAEVHDTPSTTAGDERLGSGAPGVDVDELALVEDVDVAEVTEPQAASPDAPATDAASVAATAPPVMMAPSAMMTTTTPAPALVPLDEDPAFQGLRARCAERAAALAGRAWDNLGHIEAFSALAQEAHAVVAARQDIATQRAVVHALWPLLPHAARTGRAARFSPLPPDVAARAPDFHVLPGDVPAIAPSWSAYLGTEGASARLFDVDAGPFLAPRGLCPAGAPGAATAVVLEERTRDGWRAHVPLSLWDADAPASLEVRTGPDGKALLGTDGRPQAIIIPEDTLETWLFAAGPDARGVDLRSRDDRALLLVTCHLLRERVVYGKSAFAWLEDDSARPAVRVDVINAAIDAAFEAVAAFTADPMACRISLRAQASDGGWNERAAALLDATGLFHDVEPRSTGAGFARDIVWLDGFLEPGAGAGRLSQLAAGRAFARLATSLLAPLGVLTLSGLRDGSGDVVLQRLLPPADGDGPLRLGTPLLASLGAGGCTTLWEAWRQGRGLALPDLRQSARHDIRQMPGWLAFFLEGVHDTRRRSAEEQR